MPTTDNAGSAETLPEALRLANWIESDFDPDDMHEFGYDQIAAALRHLHALASVDRWQDISTAPKQGIWHDGHNHYAEYILAWYPGARSPLRARWWYRDDSDACNFLADGDYAVFPTHWCPLPAAPSKAKGAEG